MTILNYTSDNKYHVQDNPVYLFNLNKL